MRKVDIRSKCRVNSNREMDTFVGLRCNDGDISINFPLGYHISEDDNELRKDIILLLTTLSANTERKESEILKRGNVFDEVEFPLQSYMYLIKDFFVRGYYKEQEVLYKVAKSGKINWNRTIKTQKPYVQDMDVFYLDFVTKKNSVKENELITLIHEYCVYEIIYVFLTIFLYLLKCPQSLILSALRAFCFCGKPHISRSIFLYFRYQAWLKSW